MKALAAALVTAVALTSITAQAANRIDTEGFSFAFAYHQEPPLDMSLLSEDGGTVRIGLQHIVTSAISASHHDIWEQAILFNGSVAPGYRVTSMTLTGMLIGRIEQTFPAGWGDFPVGPDWMHDPGHAWSRLSVDMTLHHDGRDTDLYPVTANNLNGMQGILAGYGGALDSDFDLTVISSAAASARRQEFFVTFPDGNQGLVQGSALASIYADNVVLTFQVTPVPEPATYGMLLGGLGILGFAAQRRRSAGIS
jgi:hypothetical protein